MKRLGPRRAQPNGLVDVSVLAKGPEHLLRVGVGVYLDVLSFYLFGAPQVVKGLVGDDVEEALTLRFQA